MAKHVVFTLDLDGTNLLDLLLRIPCPWNFSFGPNLVEYLLENLVESEKWILLRIPSTSIEQLDESGFRIHKP